MKIAIASTGKKTSSKVSEVGGRSPYYLIFEGKKLVKSIKNPFLLGGGAGFSVAQMLANEKVNLVICGRIGPNMMAALKAKKIKTMEISGISVEGALKKVK